MAIINTYLHFDGNTEEAFNFYKSVFGGEFAFLMRYGDAAQRYGDAATHSGFGEVSEDEKEKIMHVALPIKKDHVLMGQDALKSMERRINFGNNFSITVHAENRAEAENIFERLAADGKVTMPLADTFWGAYYGTCEDQFGIQWMVDCNAK
jgi:PhnB protein